MSQSSQITQNYVPNTPTLTDALNLLRRDIMLNLACHHIGTIQSFNQAEQTCSATINYPKTVFTINETGPVPVYNPTLIYYDVLIECPVISLGGGSGALTMPIQQGDECLLLFNDRDLDNWFQGGTAAALATPRTHSFSDAIALVGLRSIGNVLSHYDTARSVLRGGSGLVGVNTSNNKVLITNDSPSGSSGSYSYATTLNTMLQNLCAQLENLCTAIGNITVNAGQLPPIGLNIGGTAVAGTSSGPLNSSDFSSISSNISSIATSIADLLE